MNAETQGMDLEDEGYELVDAAGLLAIAIKGLIAESKIVEINEW